MKPIQSHKSLKATKPLTARTPLRGSLKPKKQKTSPKTLLKRKAWEEFSRYVRIRDTERVDNEWYGTCITCTHSGRVAWLDEDSKLRFDKGWDAGHYISRGNWFLRHDEENVNLQCKYHCNKMKSGNLEKYKPALDLKYGSGTRAKLDKLARDNQSYNPPKEELQQVIEDSVAQVDYYKNAQNY